jgi:AraC family transcriptional regulator
LTFPSTKLGESHGRHGLKYEKFFLIKGSFMLAEIIEVKEKILVGKSAKMSFVNNKTFELWRSFMPEKGKIQNQIPVNLFSVEVYPDNFFRDFNPANEFDKWAAVEVSNLTEIPAGMDSLIIPQGLYGVFIHKGPASKGKDTYDYIFNRWLPVSDYSLDNRPHFALMDNRYKNESEDSEEEIWIPVIKKIL